jgi:hypothetical protein
VRAVIQQGCNKELVASALWIACQMKVVASKLADDHVEISNKLHYWAEKEEIRP